MGFLLTENTCWSTSLQNRYHIISTFWTLTEFWYSLSVQSHDYFLLIDCICVRGMQAWVSHALSPCDFPRNCNSEILYEMIVTFLWVKLIAGTVVFFQRLGYLLNTSWGCSLLVTDEERKELSKVSVLFKFWHRSMLFAVYIQSRANRNAIKVQ